MSNSKTVKYYAPKEELINVVSHGLGLALSLIALVAMLLKTGFNGNTFQVVSGGVFGVSLMALYAASTFYHQAKIDEQRIRLKVFDHAAIYVLIAGTYTPYTLVALQGNVGWVLFSISWGIAIIGILLKLFFTGRFKLLSTIMYVLMGWIIVFAMKPLQDSLPAEGIQWLFIGGVAYTVGAILYSLKKIPMNHAIFHVFVLIGSISHFVSIYYYVL